MTTMDEPVTNFQGNGYVSKRFSFFRVLYFRLSQGYLTILHVCVYARDSNPVIMFLFNGIFSFLFTLLQQMAWVKAASCIQGTKPHTVTWHVPITEDTFNSTDHEKNTKNPAQFSKVKSKPQMASKFRPRNSSHANAHHPHPSRSNEKRRKFSSVT